MKRAKRIGKTFLNRGTWLFVAVLLIATIAPQILSIKVASADDGGYPWIGAYCIDGTDCSGTYNWGYTLTNGQCPAVDPSCLSYPYPSSTNPTAGMGDTWGYGVRNCTSYVAWKVNQAFGTSISGWGEAYQWSSNAPSSEVHAVSGYTPQVGDIAQWGSEVGGGHGHVAYVYAVNNGIASLDEYNSGLPRDASGNLQWGMFYSGRTTASNSAGTPDHYIHIGTPSGAVGPSVSSVIEAGGVYHVFSGTSAGTLYETVWGTGYTLTTWQVASGLNSITSISSYIDSSGTLHVFSGNSAGTDYETYWGSGQSPSTWQVASGLGSVTGISSAIDSSGTYHIFSGTSAGSLYETFWGGGHTLTTWQVASGLSSVTGISSAIDSSGAYHVFSGNSSGTLYETVWGTGYTLTTWSVASGLGSVTGISSAIDSSGTKHIFSGTSAGTLYETYWGSGSPSTWSVASGAGTVTSISAAIDSSGTYHVFSGNSAGSLHETYWGGGHTLTTWQVASGLGSVTSISSAIDSSGTYHIFSGTVDDKIYETFWGGGHTLTTWQVAAI